MFWGWCVVRNWSEKCCDCFIASVHRAPLGEPLWEAAVPDPAQVLAAQHHYLCARSWHDLATSWSVSYTSLWNICHSSQQPPWFFFLSAKYAPVRTPDPAQLAGILLVLVPSETRDRRPCRKAAQLFRAAVLLFWGDCCNSHRPLTEY